MTWTRDFISRALEGIPKDKYRKRMKAELEDHLIALARDLEDNGTAPEQAREQAVALMGAPEDLNVSFREVWLTRANNWKYCLASLLKPAVHAVLVNILARWVLIMPIVLTGRGLLFDYLESGSLLPVVLFTLVNFLPGLWFCGRELHERFAIHPRRKLFLFIGFALAWLLDIFPWVYSLLPNSIIFTPLNIFALVIIIPSFLGQIPLELLAMRSSPAAYQYLCLSVLLSLLFALFYRPKGDRPFLLGDKD